MNQQCLYLQIKVPREVRNMLLCYHYSIHNLTEGIVKELGNQLSILLKEEKQTLIDLLSSIHGFKGCTCLCHFPGQGRRSPGQASLRRRLRICIPNFPHISLAKTSHLARQPSCKAEEGNVVCS